MRFSVFIEFFFGFSVLGDFFYGFAVFISPNAPLFTERGVKEQAKWLRGMDEYSTYSTFLCYSYIWMVMRQNFKETVKENSKKKAYEVHKLVFYIKDVQVIKWQ